MPEVVVATPDVNGNSRMWDDVFPIWKIDAQDSEWRIINQILEVIAMNNRMGSRTADELKAKLIEDLNGQINELLQKNLEALQALPNVKADKCIHCEYSQYWHDKWEKPENGMYLGQPESKPDHEYENGLTDEHRELLEKRNRLFKEYGQWRYYYDNVFANFAGAHREHN